MYVSSLMNSKPQFKSGGPGSFLKGENTNLLFNCFESSNKEKMGMYQKKKVLK